MLRRAIVEAKRMFGLHSPGRNLAVFPDDTFLVSFPKSGNTWARFLIANLVRPNETIDFSKEHVLETLKEMTGGRGPDACIDAVGLEAHGHAPDAVYDRIKAATRVLETDRPHVLREAIQACRKGGTVSIPGVYGGLLDKMNVGAAFAKGLTFKMGQTHVHRYLRPLLERIERGEIDPSFVITHRMSLEDAPHGYKIFGDREDGCIKIVLKP